MLFGPDDSGEDSAPPESRAPAPYISELVSIPRSLAGILERARDLEALGLRYGYGAGRVVKANSIIRPGARLDCSEYAMYCCGVDKLTNVKLIVRFNGGWFSSDALVYDGRHVGGLFTETPVARPGYLMAVGRDGSTAGHVVIVETVRGGRAQTVIECSSYHDRRTGNAIGRRPADFMYKRGAVVLRPDWL